MPRAKKTCATPGCGEVVPTHTTKCGICRTKAEQQRGNAAARGYGSRHRVRFRAKVLERDRICVLCHEAPATHADHYPLGRDELVARGMDPNDPEHGRGLCAPCDSGQTATRQPGGWNTVN